MTKKQLDMMGFVLNTGSVYSGRLYHPEHDIEFRVKDLRRIKPEVVIAAYGEAMFEAGKIRGTREKVEQIKKALDISVVETLT